MYVGGNVPCPGEEREGVVYPGGGRGWVPYLGDPIWGEGEGGHSAQEEESGTLYLSLCLGEGEVPYPGDPVQEEGEGVSYPGHSDQKGGGWPVEVTTSLPGLV